MTIEPSFVEIGNRMTTHLASEYRHCEEQEQQESAIRCSRMYTYIQVTLQQRTCIYVHTSYAAAGYILKSWNKSYAAAVYMYAYNFSAQWLHNAPSVAIGKSAFRKSETHTSRLIMTSHGFQILFYYHICRRLYLSYLYELYVVSHVACCTYHMWCII